MKIFDTNVYWNVTLNTSIVSSNIFKSLMLISDFATFRSFEKFKVDTRMQSQSAERSKRIVQQTFKKLNVKKSRIESSSNELIKNKKIKWWICWIRKRDCLFKMIIRADCLILWRLFIVIKKRLLIEKRMCFTKWILLFYAIHAVLILN